MSGEVAEKPLCPILLGEVRNLTEHWGEAAVRAATAQVLGEAPR